jgi:hypothetical protein
MVRMLSAATALLLVGQSLGLTRIKVINNWDGGIDLTDLNVKIAGAGVGGCDIIMHPATASGPTEDDADCACLWGTVGYVFRAWLPVVGGGEDDGDGDDVAAVQGKLRGKGSKSGERGSDNSTALPFCSDDHGLGNCYGGEYTCTIGEDKLCHCAED